MMKLEEGAVYKTKFGELIKIESLDKNNDHNKIKNISNDSHLWLPEKRIIDNIAKKIR